MKLRALLFLIGIYLGILLMAIATYADVGWARVERPIKVMVIDTGVEATHYLFKGSNIKCLDKMDCMDTHGHGTMMTSLILFGELDAQNRPTSPVCNRVELISCNYMPGIMGSDKYYELCLKSALEEEVKFVNFSSTAETYLIWEHSALLKMSERGVKFVTAMGNEGRDVKINRMFPAVLSLLAPLKETVIPVIGRTRSGERWAESNYGIPAASELSVDVKSAGLGGIVRGSGTSQATALHTNRLLNEACRNQ